MSPRAFVIAILVLGTSLLALGQQEAGNVEKQYVGQTLQLRIPALSSRLRYSSTGELLEGERGPWSLASHLKVAEVKVTGDKVEVRGKRLFLFADGRVFRDFFDLFDDPHRSWPNLLEKKKYDWLFDRRDVAIEIALGSSNAQAAVDSVFEPAKLDSPPIQTVLLETGGTQQPRPAPVQSEVPLKVGGGVTAPRVLLSPNPEYNEYARKARFQGRVILWVRIGPQGRVEEIRLQRALGMGLDEEAMKAVSNWTFDPAKKDGVPVAVQINVEINFRLY